MAAGNANRSRLVLEINRVHVEVIIMITNCGGNNKSWSATIRRCGFEHQNELKIRPQSANLGPDF